MRVIVGRHLGDVLLEDARRVVHWSSNESSEGEDGGVLHRVTTKSFVFSTPSALVANQVGISAADASRTNGFVGIDHDVIVSGLGNAIEIVIVHPLPIVVFATRYYIAYITTLDSRIAVVHHKLIGLVEMTLIVACRRRSLVVHNHLHAFRCRILVDCLNVEVGIGSDEVEDIVLFVSEPVFPSFVPSFHQNPVKPVLGGKVDVSLHILRVGGMSAVGLQFRVVGLSQFHGGHIVRVCPFAFARNHVPPHTDVLCGMNP